MGIFARHKGLEVFQHFGFSSSNFFEDFSYERQVLLFLSSLAFRYWISISKEG